MINIIITTVLFGVVIYVAFVYGKSIIYLCKTVLSFRPKRKTVKKEEPKRPSQHFTTERYEYTNEDDTIYETNSSGERCVIIKGKESIPFPQTGTILNVDPDRITTKPLTINNYRV